MCRSGIFNNLGVPDNQVLLQDVYEECKVVYEYEKHIILKLLGNMCIAIEHVGSTSVKGMVAKPIIDIAVGVHDLNILKKIPAIMINGGYHHLSEHGDNDRLLFIKKKQGKCFLHIHVEIYQGESWENHLLFKEYLQKNLKALSEYNRLKKDLAARFSDDRKQYTSGKADFIQSCLGEIRNIQYIK